MNSIAVGVQTPRMSLSISFVNPAPLPKNTEKMALLKKRVTKNTFQQTFILRKLENGLESD